MSGGNALKGLWDNAEHRENLAALGYSVVLVRKAISNDKWSKKDANSIWRAETIEAANSIWRLKLAQTLLNFGREITFDPENGARGKIPIFREEFQLIRGQKKANSMVVPLQPEWVCQTL